MNLSVEKIRNVEQIANKCVEMIQKHHSKLKFLSKYKVSDIYYYLKMVPYKKDDRYKEIVLAPQFAVKLPFGDCKKKTIIFGSVLKNKKVPFRIVISSTDPNKKLHHIFTQIKVNGKYINADCTYSDNKLGQFKRVTNYKIIKTIG